MQLFSSSPRDSFFLSSSVSSVSSRWHAFIYFAESLLLQSVWKVQNTIIRRWERDRGSSHKFRDGCRPLCCSSDISSNNNNNHYYQQFKRQYLTLIFSDFLNDQIKKKPSSCCRDICSLQTLLLLLSFKKKRHHYFWPVNMSRIFSCPANTCSHTLWWP